MYMGITCDEERRGSHEGGDAPSVELKVRLGRRYHTEVKF